MPSHRVPRAVARVVLVCAGLVTALAASEAAVRLAGIEPAALMVKDPVVGQKYRPGIHTSLYDEESRRRIEIRINTLGFRDVDHADVPAPGVRRAVMLGDSFQAGMSVDFDRTFPRVAERALNAAGVERAPADDGGATARRQPWEIISLAVAGYGTAQELLAYEEYGRRFHPDVVVLNFFAGNDVSDNSSELSSSPRPYYRLSAGQLVLSRPSESRQRITAWLNEHSRLYAWQKRQMQKVERLVKRSIIVNPVDRVFMADADDVLERAWHVTESLVLRLNRVVRADGGRLLVSYIPFADEINQDWWGETLAESAPLRAARWDFDGPARRLQAFCRANGIAFASSREMLRPTISGERAYFKHGHFNERGHELYGRFLARAIGEVAGPTAAAPLDGR